MNKKHGRENDSVAITPGVVKSEVAEREEAMQAFWAEHDIFNKSLEAPAGDAPVGDFVFYDGPPFATGLPHYGHILQSTLKDAVPRFWTMNGYRVKRQWGWDCHGLPLENLIEKKLGLATKRDIEAYGVKNFNEQARGAVMEYADEWRKIIPRMGRFVDMENDYKTMDSTYTESVWWVFKSLHDKGLVYEGFKNMHLCPRCGTTLSNFEVNQGYKDIKDIAVTVKLPLLDDAGNVTDTSLLVWTTTPWTLPGNMAAAVNKEIEYIKVRVTPFPKRVEEGERPEVVKSEYIILAKDIFEKSSAIIDDGGRSFNGYIATQLEIIKGSELIGKRYQPPFDYIQKQNIEGADKAWTIYHADYVEIGEEGTGAVHIAPAYGDDDMKLAQDNNVPIIHHVDESGHFKDFVTDTDFAGFPVKPKDDEASGVDHKSTDIEILRHLQAKGVILKKENITHSYPHCWRCETPLLNYATTSWFVEVTKIKDELVKANEKVNWIPGHVGTNRFGKWLEGARDWAISRQRYWGAPLPIWKNPVTGEYKVFGSLAELKEYVPKSGNKYYLVRHGESESNVKGVLDSGANTDNPLTENGIKQVKLAAKELGSIDLVFHSPIQRCRETAELLATELGIKEDSIIVDDRLRESGMGELEGQPLGSKEKLFATPEEEFTKEIKGVENLNQIKQRVGSFLYEIDEKYKNKNILVVSHGDPLWMLDAVNEGTNIKSSLEILDKDYPKNAQVRIRDFVALPHNDNYELDFHRPYIDEIELYEGGVKLERVPDVFDCWFESGSMPYAQNHYPFSCADTFEKDTFPAQFIGEGLDQTRGWFYSMIVLGVALFGKSPFENVITNGLVLAEDGRKMSKSLQNYPDPMELVAKFGADSMRFYLLSSSLIRGEDVNFSEKEVNELQRKNIGRLHNVLAMYEMFTPRVLPTAGAEGACDGTQASDNSDNVLDRWIISRLNQLVAETTAGYKNYELDKAARPITDFIDDLSVWYLRRSRERLKGEDTEDKTKALATLRHTLRTLALVMAPAMPFYAEYLWQAVKEENDAESVHLAKWPKEGIVDPVVLGEMSIVREFVTLALEARTKANIKVRQPLSTLYTNIELENEYSEIVAEEINVKEVISDTSLTERVSLDTKLTSELIAEGTIRELVRAVQERRKAEGLSPKDRITLTISTDQTGQNIVNAYSDLIKKTVGASTLEFGETEGEKSKIGETNFGFSIKLT